MNRIGSEWIHDSTARRIANPSKDDMKDQARMRVDCTNDYQMVKEGLRQPMVRVSALKRQQRSENRNIKRSRTFTK